MNEITTIGLDLAKSVWCRPHMSGHRDHESVFEIDGINAGMARGA
jgi:hypothetical protein